MQRSFLLLPYCFRIFCCHFCLGSKRNTNKSQKMSTSPEDTRLSCLCFWAWNFPWLFCFSLFPEFLNFVLYSYGVSHDFYDNLRDRFKRKMAFSGTAAHGNSPTLNHPFGFYSWSLPSQNQLRDKKMLPQCSQHLEEWDSCKHLWCLFRKKSQKMYAMHARLVHDIDIAGKSSAWAWLGLYPCLPHVICEPWTNC